MSKFRLVLVTTSSTDEAERIAHKIIEKRLAACANILPKVRSIYHWQNEIHEDREALMLIKTDAKLLSKLEKQIKKMHSYDVPEFLVLDIDGGSETYTEWLSFVLK
jgi:periplasmic divalent cation tolerance protein